MNATHAQRRKRRIFALAGLAVALWVVLGLTSLTLSPGSNSHSKMGDAVLAGFSQTRADAQRIRFTLADERYTLARTQPVGLWRKPGVTRCDQTDWQTWLAAWRL